MKSDILPVIRELARTYQAFTHYSAAHVRELGLTPPQFDVICTLGNTQGMPLCRLAEKTLITKGTLTGVLDRLEQKGLLKRIVPPENRR
ncbi:MAG TPA: MarR family transcriptional regulator, partial [Burkholderiales bacterium]|nr:MarR family transcriptional regulator [Burkholderiales bacterium]